MPKETEIRTGPGGKAILHDSTAAEAFTPLYGNSVVDYAFLEPVRSYLKAQGASALKQAAAKAGGALVTKAIPTAMAVTTPQATHNAMAENPWIDENLSRAEYMAKKAGKPMGMQYPTGKRGPSYVKPSYPGQSTVSRLMGVKNPKR
jgi:hypothetical protein